MKKYMIVLIMVLPLQLMAGERYIKEGMTEPFYYGLKTPHCIVVKCERTLSKTEKPYGLSLMQLEMIDLSSDRVIATGRVISFSAVFYISIGFLMSSICIYRGRRDESMDNHLLVSNHVNESSSD